MESNKQLKNNRLILLSIVGIPITIVLAATWLWYFVAKGDLDLVGILGTANKGSLVQPLRYLDDGKLLGANGVAFNYADLPPKWTFLVPGGDNCDTQCEELLYLTRQIHQAMGKELHRIRRFYVGDTNLADTGFAPKTLSDNHPMPVSFAGYMEAEQHGMPTFTVSPDKHASLFPEYADKPDTWYLVDPAGWIMMSYDGQVTYKDVISDLKFLLKNSSE